MKENNKSEQIFSFLNMYLLDLVFTNIPNNL